MQLKQRLQKSLLIQRLVLSLLKNGSLVSRSHYNYNRYYKLIIIGTKANESLKFCSKNALQQARPPN
jgi:hypothetical protein